VTRLASWLTPVLVALIWAVPSLAQEPSDQAPVAPAAKHQLSILLVAGEEQGRSKAFEAFLRKHFAKVETASRVGFDPKSANAMDVVLLDWPQGKDAREMRAAGNTPLGDFEGWTIPTVLIGSAGLNVASAWGVRGGFG
jgi:hypothetical protein